MKCPSCQTAMEQLMFVSPLGAAVEIDVCWPCHMIWFDHMESTALSPNAVVELFRQIQSHEKQARNLVSMRSICPTCASALVMTNDLGRGGRFSYFRCPTGHGRLIAFVQFLREKQFIRTLLPHELTTLSATVAQIRCSSCGAPVDLKTDSSCTHCGAPIAVLDKDAVTKALAAYDKVAAERAARHLNMAGTVAMGGREQTASTYRRDSGMQEWPRNPSQPLADLSLADLVVSGLAALVTAALD